MMDSLDARAYIECYHGYIIYCTPNEFAKPEVMVYDK